MTELFLKYNDDNGAEKRAPVKGEKFFVGRHSESDLCIPDGRLSRQHVKIETLGDKFKASDAGSSNGTKLNDKQLTEPVELNNGDRLELGGLKMFVEIKSDEDVEEPPMPEADVDAPEAAANGMGDLPAPAFGVPAAPAFGAPAVPAFGAPAAPAFGSPAAPAEAKSSSSMLLLVFIPILGLILLVFAGVVVYLLVSEPTTTTAKKSGDRDDLYGDSDDLGSTSKSPKDKVNTDSGTTTPPTGTNSSGNSGTTETPSGTNSAPPGKLSDVAKIEKNGGAFLRSIAQNNPRAFLTSEQAERVSSKVKQLGSSSAVADNLKNANKNSSALKSLAASKNLKPQFLAIAAVAKLGGSRGDVLQTAQGMTDVLDKLTTHLGNELADDSLLVIAAYGQGSAGDFMKMRNMLQDLATKSPESSRAIRTIWFLQKNGKITQSEYENALNFLAIGTISQNPKEFGVNAEALTL